MDFAQGVEALGVECSALTDARKAALQAKYDAEIKAMAGTAPVNASVGGNGQKSPTGAPAPTFDLSAVVLACQRHTAAMLTASDLKVDLVRAERPAGPAIDASQRDASPRGIEGAICRTAGLPGGVWNRRRFLKAVGAGMALWPVAGIRPAKADSKPLDIKIFWAADSHLRHGGEDDFNNILRPPLMMKYASWQKLRQIRDEANAEKPAHVFHLGDACEPTQAIEDFTGIFHSITVPHDLALGNHDLGRFPEHVNGGRPPSLSELERWHGYDHARQAGSGFNYSRQVAQRIRVIVLDANWDRHGRHLAGGSGSHTGRLTQDILDWVARELSGLGKHLVFIAGHHPPHLHAGSGVGVATTFAASDARALSAVVERAAANNPQLQIIGMFGHYHPNGRVTDSSLDPKPDYYWQGIMKAANLGAHFPAYIIPEIVYTESEKSLYVVTTIRETDKGFTVDFATRKLEYEPPQ